MPEIISRAEARERGLKQFFTGEPCSQRHICGRYVSSGRCVECILEQNRLWAAKNPEKIRENAWRWEAKNLEKIRENARRRYAENPEVHENKRLLAALWAAKTWQRCRVHWMRNALAHVPKGQHTMVAAAIRQAFLQTNAEAAHQTWRHVADQLRGRWPKLAALMDESEHDVLAYITFPAQHRTKLHSTDEIDKPFRRDLLFWSGTGDRAAKSRARGCKPDHAAFSVVPHLRHPCAASSCHAAAIG